MPDIIDETTGEVLEPSPMPEEVLVAIESLGRKANYSWETMCAALVTIPRLTEEIRRLKKEAEHGTSNTD